MPVDKLQSDIDRLKAEIHLLALAMGKIQSDLGYIKDCLACIEETQQKYVTLEAFTPVKILAYGAVAMICSSSVGAILATVLKK